MEIGNFVRLGSDIGRCVEFDDQEAIVEFFDGQSMAVSAASPSAGFGFAYTTRNAIPRVVEARGVLARWPGRGCASSRATRTI